MGVSGVEFGLGGHRAGTLEPLTHFFPTGHAVSAGGRCAVVRRDQPPSGRRVAANCPSARAQLRH